MEETSYGPQYLAALKAQQDALEMRAAEMQAEDEATMMEQGSAIGGKVDADIEAAFRAGFKNQRGSDREVRVQAPKADASFSKQVNKQADRGDAGGQGRTQDAPPVKAIPGEHEVKEKDTMWALAKRYGISVDEIQRLNEGVDPRRMQLGSKLRLTDAPQPKAAPQQVASQSKTIEAFNQHMVNFDPRADAIEPVAPLESLVGGAGAAKAAYQVAKTKGPELSAAMQRILSGRGARPAQPAAQSMGQADRFRAMDEMVRRGPPTSAPGRSYPNEAPPSWLTRGRR